MNVNDQEDEKWWYIFLLQQDTLFVLLNVMSDKKI